MKILSTLFRYQLFYKKASVLFKRIEQKHVQTMFYSNESSEDKHRIVQYIEKKRHMYDELEPSSSFDCQLVGEQNELYKIYAKIFDESFVYEGNFGSTLTPVLEIDQKNFGAITNKNIKELLQLAKSSNFGQGYDTIYDEKVRKSKEIDATRLKINNLDLRPVIQKLNEYFGVEFKEKLYKLVIYEKGGHFDFHKDSVHSNSHLATLLIGLPINYTGGELLVAYPNDPKNWKIFKLFDNYVAFYTDCEHAINKVQDGYRVVIQYDLNVLPSIEDETKKPKKKQNELLSMDVLDRFIQSKREINQPDQYNWYWIKKLSDSLTKNDFEKHKIGFLLKHQYANKFLNKRLLKGTDKILYNELVKQFDVELRYVVLEIEKFSELGLFYLKCKAFKIEETDQVIKKSPYEESLENERKEEELEETGLTEQLAQSLKEKERTLNLILTQADHARLIDKKKLFDYTGNDAQLVHEYKYFAAVLIVNNTLNNLPNK